MRTTLYGVLGSTMTWIGLVAAGKAPLTAQAQRGREIFQHSAKGTACATCHAMAGVEEVGRTCR